MANSLLEKPTALPAWCSEQFPEQVKSLQTESEQCRDQIKKLASRMEYIQNIFSFCSKNLDALDLSDAQAIPTLTKVLNVLGWQVQPLESVPSLIKLTDEAQVVSYALVASTLSPIDRSRVGALILAQTQYWETSGSEVVAFVIHDVQRKDAVPDDVLTYARKRAIGLLSKQSLARCAAEVLIAEADPDDVRAAVLSNLE